MRIRMLGSQIASPDGIQVNLYRAGEKYDLPEIMARGFILQGTAEEDKDMGQAPETKENFEWPWGNEQSVTKPKKVTKKIRGG